MKDCPIRSLSLAAEREEAKEAAAEQRKIVEHEARLQKLRKSAERRD